MPQAPHSGMASLKHEKSRIGALVHPGLHREVVSVSSFASSSRSTSLEHGLDAMKDDEFEGEAAIDANRLEARERLRARLEGDSNKKTNLLAHGSGFIDLTLDSSHESISTARTKSSSDSDREGELREILFVTPTKRARCDHSEDPRRDSWLEVRKDLEQTILDMRNKLKEREDRIAALEEEVTTETRRKVVWQKRSTQATKERDDASRQLTAAQQKLACSERKCAHLQSELRTTKDLLNVRTDELSVAQAFMTTADQFSVADMRRLVEEINNDIYQCSVSLADMVLDSQSEPTPDDAKRLEDARNTVLYAYGKNITARIQSDTSQGDTVVFECAVQNIIVTRCCFNFSTLCPENEGADKVLSSLREKILQSHKLPIAKNWVAMTTAQIQGSQEDPAATLRFLTDLMLVAGWRPKRLSPPQPPSILAARYQDITTKTLKLRQMAAEGILSQDIQVYTVLSGAPYAPEVMQDAFDCGKKSKGIAASSREEIICSTAMGMRTVKRTHPSDPSWAKRTRIEEVILKPKVLLASSLSADEEAEREA